MSVCSATAAASQRPVGRRDSRKSASRSSASETYFCAKKGGVGQYGQRKCSSASSSKSSSLALCCAISVVMICIGIPHIAFLNFVITAG
ncbi:hypothetical protein DPMN_105011 [Dreissena polymorpha]|uniref:Uncharacterized protein n=1 Tax=Dreissena polymorpha TaxID=45954 RepID=A0A9D4K2Y7_DREPO|nr:hypothetical protein DPMN_105011 [Dreissena polymorpha]